MKRLKKATFTFLVVFLSISSFSEAEEIRGKVFLDLNSNGICEGEKGIENVAVSDGKDIVLSDSLGNFKFASPYSRFIFIIKPKGYLPTTCWYADLSKKKTEEIFFGLRKNSEPDEFIFLHFTDVHGSFEKMRQEIQMFEKVDPAPSFVINTGDICGPHDIKNTYVKEVADKVKTPIYDCVGNHDFAAEERLYMDGCGPIYHSFNYSSAHFLVIDTHLTYEGAGNYIMGLREDQLNWIKKDLSLHKDRDIILCLHEPEFFFLYERDKLANVSQLVDFLKGCKVIAALGGHGHNNHVFRIRNINFPVIETICTGGSKTFGSLGWTPVLTRYDVSGGRPGGYRIFGYSKGKLDNIMKEASGKPHQFGIAEVAGKPVNNFYPATGFFPVKDGDTFKVIYFPFEKGEQLVEWRIDEGDWKVAGKLIEENFYGSIKAKLDIEGISPGGHELWARIRGKDLFSDPLPIKIGEATILSYLDKIVKYTSVNIDNKYSLRVDNTGKFFELKLGDTELIRCIYLTIGPKSETPGAGGLSSFTPLDKVKSQILDIPGGKKIISEGRYSGVKFDCTSIVDHRGIEIKMDCEGLEDCILGSLGILINFVCGSEGGIYEGTKYDYIRVDNKSEEGTFYPIKELREMNVYPRIKFKQIKLHPEGLPLEIEVMEGKGKFIDGRALTDGIYAVIGSGVSRSFEVHKGERKTFQVRIKMPEGE